MICPRGWAQPSNDVALVRLEGPLGGVVAEVIVDGIVKSVGYIGRKVSD